MDHGDLGTNVPYFGCASEGMGDAALGQQDEPEVSAGAFAPLLGDYYNESVDVSRGVSTCGGYEASRLPGIRRPELSSAAGIYPTAESTFSDAVEPRDLPEGGPATSVVLKTTAAKSAMCVYKFLMNREGTSVLKVSVEKFAIVATAFCEGLLAPCTLKVKVFRMPTCFRKVVLEVSRREGDSVTFSEIYKQMTRHLEAHFGDTHYCGINVLRTEVSSAAGLVDVSKTPVPCFPVTESDLQVLVDIVVSSAYPCGQAEAVAKLAAIARENSVQAAAVCSALSHIQSLWTELLGSSRFEVVHPAAYIASRLTACNAQH